MRQRSVFVRGVETPRGTLSKAHQQPFGHALIRQLRIDLHSERVLLLPVRAFIGLGWLRAGVEKLADPDWLNGATLTGFLTDQFVGGQVVFRFYAGLINAVFLPQAQLLSGILMIGQLLAGLAILAGCFSTAALVGALFMNLNFLLAGVPNPSAFYLVIQLALLLANAGAVVGGDAWLGRFPWLAWLTARPPMLVPTARRRAWMQLLMLLLCILSAAGAATAISDFSPAGSVHDPAMILTILSSMAAGWAGLSYLRQVLPHTAELSGTL